MLVVFDYDHRRQR